MIKRHVKNPIKRTIKRSVRSFSIPGLFRDGEEGTYYDANDLTTLCQTYNGTAGNVTAVGDPVGRMEDRRAPENFSTVTYTSDFSAGADSFTSVLGTAAGNIDSVGPAGDLRNDCLRNTKDITGGASYLQRTTRYVIGKKTSTALSVFVPAAQAYIDGFQVRTDAGAVIYNGDGISNVWVDISTTHIPDGTSLQVYSRDGASDTISALAVGELLYVRAIVIATSSLNDAIQATAGSRPLLGIQPKSGVRNLLTYSEQFDNSVWVKSACSISANAATAPDGTVTADRLIDTSVDTEHSAYREIVDAAGSHTHLIYVKKDATNWVFVQVWEGISYFDTLNGVAGTPGAGCTISIVDAVVDFPALGAGSGWWRLAITSTALGTEAFLAVGPAEANGDRFYAGSGASGLYIWGAQIAAGSTVTTYQRKGAWYDCTEGAGIVPANAAANAHALFLALDGVDDFMTVPGTASSWKFLHNGTGGFASLGVQAGIVPSPGVAYELLASSRNSTFVGTSFRYDGAASQNRLQFFVANGAANIVSVSTATDSMPARTPAIVSSQYSEADNPDYSIKRNGVTLTSGDDTGVPSSANAGSDYEVCQNPSGGGIPLLGKFFSGVIRQGVLMPDSQYQLTRTQGDAMGVTI